MINIIIGKSSNLSKALAEKLENVILISSMNILEELDSIDFTTSEKINIIFNQFQAASKLHILESPVEYISRSIVSTAKVLEYIQTNRLKINKILYTSSSSVYGNNTSCLELDTPHPMSLHASLKLANENLISKFCEEEGINYTITRLFNMYGGDDKFSIVSKIINIKESEAPLTLINNGEGIRDFIHIDDVVYSYMKLLHTMQTIPLVNIGTADGKSLLYILNYLRNFDVDIQTVNITQDELKVSISDNTLLLQEIGPYDFIKVEEYILKRIKAKNE